MLHLDKDNRFNSTTTDNFTTIDRGSCNLIRIIVIIMQSSVIVLIKYIPMYHHHVRVVADIHWSLKLLVFLAADTILAMIISILSLFAARSHAYNNKNTRGYYLKFQKKNTKKKTLLKTNNVLLYRDIVLTLNEKNLRHTFVFCFDFSIIFDDNFFFFNRKESDLRKKPHIISVSKETRVCTTNILVLFSRTQPIVQQTRLLAGLKMTFYKVY